MKRLLLLTLLTINFSLLVNAQTNATIKSLQNKRASLQKEIAQQETLLGNTTKDVRTQLRNIATLEGQIDARRQYIHNIQLDIDTINSETRRLQHALDSLTRQLTQRKERYAKSLQRLYRARKLPEKLMFIFSSKSLSEAYRRNRHLEDYANYQRVLAAAITQQQEKIALKQAEMQSVREAKLQLMNEGREQQQKLQQQQQERQRQVTNLQKQQKAIQSEITKQKKEAQKLNSEIDRQVAIEIEKARKRAEEEARKKAAAEKAAAEKAKNAKATTASTPKSTTTASASKTENTVPPKQEAYKTSDVDIKLSSNFASNKGRLPMPITGGYIITRHYGLYSPAKGVQLDNQGINIEGQPGAQARAIFDGEVTAVFQVNGLLNVIVRHGTYLSVYCNLSSVSVKKGQKVSTRQPLGTIYSDPSDNRRTTLQFQLRQEINKLNPELWLAK